MNRLKTAIAALLLIVPLLSSCASYNAYEKARGAEKKQDWDTAVTNLIREGQLRRNPPPPSRDTNGAS